MFSYQFPTILCCGKFCCFSKLVNSNSLPSLFISDLHTVKKIKLSLPIVHDIHSCERIQWKVSHFLTTQKVKKLWLALEIIQYQLDNGWLKIELEGGLKEKYF